MEKIKDLYNSRLSLLGAKPGVGKVDLVINLIQELAIKNNKSIEYNGRKHVGIQNTLKRLEIMYGDKAEINFFNMTEHCGAVVEIRIPAKRE